MDNKKEDRRIKITKRVFKETMIELLLKKPIDAISVKEICERADLSRSTFYAHYKDQYDLLEQISEEVFDNVKAYLAKQDYTENVPVSAQILIRILEYAKENASTVKALLSDNSGAAFQRDIMQFTRIVSFPSGIEIDEKTKAYVSLFGITGCVSMLNKWIHEGMAVPTQELAEMMLQVLYHGITSF